MLVYLCVNDARLNTFCHAFAADKRSAAFRHVLMAFETNKTAFKTNKTAFETKKTAFWGRLRFCT
jgi:hypothetical protein